VTLGPAPARAAPTPDALVGGQPSQSGLVLPHAGVTSAPGEATDGAFGDLADSPWAIALADDWA
jgi:hypothetical protein